MKNVFALTALLLVGSQAPAGAIPLLDTVGATPTAQFSLFGSSGVDILPTQFVGPQFTIRRATLLTEIGGYVNNSTGSTPLTVQIRPSAAGLPDASTVLASLTLSHDDDPFTVSYETVDPNLVLGRGRYYALFAPQDDSQGFLLAGASDPFAYLAGLTTLGCLGPGCGTQAVFDGFGAVRIEGRSARSVPEPATFILVGSGLIGLMLARKKARGRA